jgi:hypothetical protein
MDKMHETLLKHLTSTKKTFNKMEIKQTALDFLLTELDIDKLISRENLTIAAEVVRQAKEMHKQEIENAFVECWKANMPDGYECKLSAEQYYNETFGGKDII